MDIITAPSKSIQVAEHLKNEILSRKLKPGTKLSSIRSLAKIFPVNKKVIENAMDLLEKENLIDRRRRSGVYVKGQEQGEMQKSIALFISIHGHIYENLTNRLVTTLQRSGLTTTLVDNDEYIEDNGRQEKILSELLQRRTSAMIIDGAGGFPFHLFEQYKDKLPKTVFINRYEHGFRLDGLYVLSDYSKGIRLATEHLLRTGRRRIMLLLFSPRIIKKKGYYPYSMHNMMQESFIEAMAKAGLSPTILHEGKSSEDLERILSSPDRPEAVIANNDFRAKNVMDICGKLGIKIPGDLSIVGYFDTPWAEMLTPKLTSVSICEDQIVDTAICKFMESKLFPDSPELIYVDPVLKIRSSSTR